MSLQAQSSTENHHMQTARKEDETPLSWWSKPTFCALPKSKVWLPAARDCCGDGADCVMDVAALTDSAKELALLSLSSCKAVRWDWNCNGKGTDAIAWDWDRFPSVRGVPSCTAVRKIVSSPWKKDPSPSMSTPHHTDNWSSTILAIIRTPEFHTH